MPFCGEFALPNHTLGHIVDLFIIFTFWSSSLPQNGFTALMYASRGGHHDIVRELLAAKADVSVQNKVSMLNTL